MTFTTILKSKTAVATATITAMVFGALAIANISSFVAPNTVAAWAGCANGQTLSQSEFHDAFYSNRIQIYLDLDTTGLKATSRVVNDTDCAAPVSLIDYKMFDNDLLNQEYFDGYRLITVPAHGTKTFTTNIPSCLSQVDFYYGLGPKQFTTSNTNVETFKAMIPFNQGPGGVNGNFTYARGNFCTKDVPPPVKPAIPAPTVTTTCEANTSKFRVNFTDAQRGSQGYHVDIDTNGWVNNGWYKFLSSGTLTTTGPEGFVPFAGSNLPSFNFVQDQTYQVRVWYKATNEYSPTVSFKSAKCTPPPVEKGCIEITKETYSANGDRVTSRIPGFTFRLDGNKTTRNNSSGIARFTDVPVGSHTVTENSYSGWNMTSVTPSNGQVNVVAGTQCAEVTFKNTKIQTNSNLSISCAANPSSVNVGNTVTWTATANGGNGNYTYAWSGTDSLNGTHQTVSKSYNSTGTKSGTVTVTSGTQSLTAQCSVNVQETQNNTLAVSCYANPSNPYTGDQVTWGANASGGNGNYTYSWSGDENLSGNSQTVSRSYGSIGNKYGTVTVYSGGQSISRQCNVYVQERNNTNNNLGASCYVTPSNPRIGDQVQWTVNAYGGNGNYSYSWNGSDNLYGSSQTVYRSYNTEGNKYASVTVYSNGQSVTQNCTTFIGSTYTPPPTYYPPQTPPPTYVYLNQVPYTGVGSTMKVVLFVLSLMAWSSFIAYMVIRAKARKNGMTVREQVASNVSDNIKALKAKLAAGDKYNFLQK